MPRVFKRKRKDSQTGRVVEDARWTIEYTDHRQLVKRFPGTPDRSSTRKIATKLQDLVACRQARTQPEGDLARWIDELPPKRLKALADRDLIDARRFAAAQPLTKHIADFEAKMQADGCTAKHIADTKGMIEAVVEACGFTLAGEIDQTAFDRHIAKLAKQGTSTRRLNGIKTAMKSFAAWLVATEKLHRNPLANVRRGNVKADRRQKRRAFAADEFEQLVQAIETEAEAYGMSGRERALLYRVAVQTGLRASELRSLTVGQCRLRSTQPHVLVDAGSTKNRQTARQYLRPNTADQVAEHVARKSPAATVFNMPPSTKTAEMIRGDLATARQKWLETIDDPEQWREAEESGFLRYEDAEGQRLDFHALRHTCGAWLAMAGQHPNVVKRIMRHSTITLTMDTYGHLFPGEDVAAIESLPDVPDPEEAQAVLALATGTDGPAGPKA